MKALPAPLALSEGRFELTLTDSGDGLYVSVKLDGHGISYRIQDAAQMMDVAGFALAAHRRRKVSR